MSWVPGAAESEVSAGPLQTGIVCSYLPFNFLRFFFFYVDQFEVFFECVTTLLLFYLLGFLAVGYVGSQRQTRSQTCNPCIGRRSLTTGQLGKFLPFNLLVFIMEFIFSKAL